MANLKVRPNWRGTGSNDNAVNFYQVNLGKKSHAGLLLGGGTSADPVTTSVADQKTASFYTSNSATSGESYGFYWRNYVTGVAASGTCARFYSTTNVAADTLQGAQITASTGAAGAVSGLLVGCRSQVQLADDATAAPTGTIAGGQSEIYFDGDNSSTTNIAAASAHSIHRFIVAGDTTARAKCVNLFEIVNVSTGTSNTTAMIKTDMHTAAPTDGIRVLVNGAAYHLGLYAI
jgi:hypothetical protein